MKEAKHEKHFFSKFASWFKPYTPVILPPSGYELKLGSYHRH